MPLPILGTTLTAYDVLEQARKLREAKNAGAMEGDMLAQLDYGGVGANPPLEQPVPPPAPMPIPQAQPLPLGGATGSWNEAPGATGSWGTPLATPTAQPIPFGQAPPITAEQLRNEPLIPGVPITPEFRLAREIEQNRPTIEAPPPWYAKVANALKVPTMQVAAWNNLGILPPGHPDAAELAQQTRRYEVPTATPGEGFWGKAKETAANTFYQVLALAPYMGEVAVGYGLGGPTGGTGAGYILSRGMIRGELLNEGISDNVASAVAAIVGVPYALSEQAQVQAAIPQLQEIARTAKSKTVKTVVTNFLKNWAEQVGQEVVQRGMEEVSQDAAAVIEKGVSGKEIPLRGPQEYVRGMGEEALGVALPLGVVGIPGAAVQFAQDLQDPQLRQDLMDKLRRAKLPQPGMSIEEVGGEQGPAKPDAGAKAAGGPLAEAPIGIAEAGGEGQKPPSPPVEAKAPAPGEEPIPRLPEPVPNAVIRNAAKKMGLKLNQPIEKLRAQLEGKEPAQYTKAAQRAIERGPDWQLNLAEDPVEALKKPERLKLVQPSAEEKAQTKAWREWADRQERTGQNPTPPSKEELKLIHQLAKKIWGEGPLTDLAYRNFLAATFGDTYGSALELTPEQARELVVKLREKAGIVPGPETTEAGAPRVRTMEGKTKRDVIHYSTAAEEAVRRFGEDGIQIGVALTEQELKQKLLAGTWNVELAKVLRPLKTLHLFGHKKIDRLTGLIDSKFRDVLEPGDKTDPKMIAAARAFKTVFADDAARRASELGVEVTMPDGTKELFSKHVVENYMRHQLTDAAQESLGVTGSNYRQRALNHLVITGQAADEKQAAEMLGRVLSHQPTGPRYGYMDRPRVADLPADMYETRLSILLPRMVHGASNFLSRVEHFGQNGERVKPLVDAISAKYVDPKDPDAARREVEELVGRAMGTKGQEAGNPMVGGLVRWTAWAGLSSPFSWVKNVFLGQAADFTAFRIHSFISGTFRAIAHPFKAYETAKRVGAIEGATQQYSESFGSKYHPMAIGERLIRPISILRAEEASKDALRVLRGGRPSIALHYIIGDFNPKASARAFFKDFLRFEDKHINAIVQRGSFTDAEMDRIRYMGQRAAQGVTTVAASTLEGPFSGKKSWAPFAIFKRYAYQGSRMLYNRVVKPTMRGDMSGIWHWVIGFSAAGAALNGLKSLFWGERRDDWNDDLAHRALNDFLDAEGLGLLSNFLDRKGTVEEELGGAVLRSAGRVLRTVFWDIPKRHFTAEQALDETISTVAAYTFAKKALQRERSDYYNTRRAYSYTEKRLGWTEDATGRFYRTSKTPYYEAVRESLWHKPEHREAAGATVMSAVQFLVNEKGMTRKDAESRIKSVISATRPIPVKREKQYVGTLPAIDQMRTKAVVDDWAKRATDLWKEYERQSGVILYPKPKKSGGGTGIPRPPRIPMPTRP